MVKHILSYLKKSRRVTSKKLVIFSKFKTSYSLLIFELKKVYVRVNTSYAVYLQKLIPKSLNLSISKDNYV